MAGVVLTVLLVALATLQYRWLGEVGEAERGRMRESLRLRAADFTQEFDRELTRIYIAFHLDAGALDRDPGAVIGAALDKAQASAAGPGLIKDVFLLQAQGPRGDVLRGFDAAARALRPVEWPPAIAAWRGRTIHAAPPGVAGTLPMLVADAIDGAAPALIIPVPLVKTTDDGAGHLAVLTSAGPAARAIIVWLDVDRLRRQLLEPLVAKYFGAGDASECLVSIVQRDQPSQAIYASANDSPVDEGSADVSAGLFDLRMDEIARLTDLARGGPAPVTGTMADRVAITIVRRSGSAAEARRVLMTGGVNQGAWQLRARYRSGSLESIVARSRRRNLAISLGVLGLLGAAFSLAMAAGQRQRRLARQQMEFVASVSHELRTPLAVICSAGENLADGVVADSAQVKSYGSLIESEGRRLGDMVERVMEFAGISSGAAIRPRAGVDLDRVVADAVQGVSAEAHARGITVTVHPNGTLPAVTGDADALRSAVQNLVGNAVKYSANGANVDVTASADGIGVEVRVADRGLGIDAEDLPHIFEPFYRGRRAVEAQIRGTGVGLSVVRHVIAAHRGTIGIDSHAGEGTTVTVKLPA